MNNLEYCRKCESWLIHEEYHDHFCFSGTVIRTEYLDLGDIVLHLDNGTNYRVTKKFLDYVHQPKGNTTHNNRRGNSTCLRVLSNSQCTCLRK